MVADGRMPSPQKNDRGAYWSARYASCRSSSARPFASRHPQEPAGVAAPPFARHLPDLHLFTLRPRRVDLLEAFRGGCRRHLESAGARRSRAGSTARRARWRAARHRRRWRSARQCSSDRPPPRRDAVSVTSVPGVTGRMKLTVVADGCASLAEVASTARSKTAAVHPPNIALIDSWSASAWARQTPLAVGLERVGRRRGGPSGVALLAAQAIPLVPRGVERVERTGDRVVSFEVLTQLGAADLAARRPRDITTRVVRRGRRWRRAGVSDRRASRRTGSRASPRSSNSRARAGAVCPRCCAARRR